MFAFSPVQHNTTGFRTTFEPTMPQIWDAAFNYAQRDTFAESSIYTAELNALERHGAETDQRMLTVQELTDKFPLPRGSWEFPEYEQVAELKHKRRLAEEADNFYLEQIARHNLPGVLGALPNPTSFKSWVSFGASVAGSAAHPFDAALMALPWVGAGAKAVDLAGKSAIKRVFATGLIKLESLPLASRFPGAMHSLGNNLIANTFLESAKAVRDIEDEGKIDWTDSFKNIVAGSLAGEAIRHVVTHGVHLIAALTPDTQARAFKKAVEDIVSGKDVDISPVVKASREVVELEISEAAASRMDDFAPEPRPKVEIESEIEKVKQRIKEKTPIMSEEDARALAEIKVQREEGAIRKQIAADLELKGHLGEVNEAVLTEVALREVINNPDSQILANVKKILESGDRSFEALASMARDLNLVFSPDKKSLQVPQAFQHPGTPNRIQASPELLAAASKRTPELLASKRSHFNKLVEDELNRRASQEASKLLDQRRRLVDKYTSEDRAKLSELERELKEMKPREEVVTPAKVDENLNGPEAHDAAVQRLDKMKEDWSKALSEEDLAKIAEEEARFEETDEDTVVFESLKKLTPCMLENG